MNKIMSCFIRKSRANFLILLLFFGGTLLQSELPDDFFPSWGADAVPDLYSPGLTGAGAFSTSTGGAPVSGVNPAQGGEARRIVFDLSYMGLAGFLGEEDGYGNVIGIGALFPSRYGVFGGSLRYIGSPFAGFPVKDTLSGNFSFAKEVYPRTSVGVGLNFGVGFDKGDPWTLSADLGFRRNVGKVGFLDNFTWAAVIRGMGKSWAPSWFTPMGGISFDFVHVEGKENKRDPLRMNFSLDMGLPVYPTTLIIKTGLLIDIAEMVTISASWPGGSGVNARELAEKKTEFNPLPSVGLGFNIILPSSGKRIAGGRLPSDGDLSINTAARPLYDGVFAIGGGVTWAVGIADKKPPVITIDYPASDASGGSSSPSPQSPVPDPQIMYFSHNNDGKADYLEFPLSITDEQYVES
jgi:hypothetical protein